MTSFNFFAPFIYPCTFFKQAAKLNKILFVDSIYTSFCSLCSSFLMTYTNNPINTLFSWWPSDSHVADFWEVT